MLFFISFSFLYVHYKTNSIWEDTSLLHHSIAVRKCLCRGENVYTCINIDDCPNYVGGCVSMPIGVSLATTNSLYCWCELLLSGQQNGNCDSLSGAGNLLRPTCHRLSSSATRCDVRNYYTGLHINARPLARGELDSLRATRSALPACPAGYYIIRPLLQCFLTINNEFYYIYSNLWTAMVSWPRVLSFS